MGKGRVRWWGVGMDGGGLGGWGGVRLDSVNELVAILVGVVGVGGRVCGRVGVGQTYTAKEWWGGEGLRTTAEVRPEPTRTHRDRLPETDSEPTQNPILSRLGEPTRRADSEPTRMVCRASMRALRGELGAG